MMLGFAAAFAAKRRNEDFTDMTADVPSPPYEPLF